MLFLIIIFLFFNSSFAVCPDGAIPVQSSFGGKWPCLLFDFVVSQVALAENECVKNGGHLLSIPNGFFNLFVAQAADKAFGDGSHGTTFWIGVTKLFGDNWTNIDDGSQTTFFNWAPGEPNNSSALNKCVYEDVSGYWYSGNCSKNLPYVCELNEIATTTNILISQVALAENECIKNGGHLLSIPNGFFNLFVAQAADKAFGDGSHGTTFWIGVTKLFGDNWTNIDDGSQTTFFNWAPGEPNNSSALNKCVYEDVSGYWYSGNCSKNLPYVCELNEINVSPTTPPPTTTSPCANGGSYINGTCLCSLGWTGDYCSTYICHNNGTMDQPGHCQCLPGTTGQFCDDFACTPKNQQVDFNTLNRQMMFILDITNRNAPALSSLATYIPEIVRQAVSSDNNWISSYFVIGVDSSKATLLGTANGTDVGELQSIFSYAAHTADDSGDNSTHIPLYEGLTNFLNKLNDNSFINIFTTAAPDGYNTGYNLVLSGRHLLNVYIATDSDGNYFSGNASDWKSIHDLVTISGGKFMTMESSNFYLGMNLIPTWYSSQVIDYVTFPDCTHNSSLFVPIDGFTQSIQIYLNGKNAGVTQTSSTLYVQLPNGTTINVENPAVADLSNGFGVFNLRKPCEGQWSTGGAALPYCFQAAIESKTWNDAKQACTASGGFLADDMTQSKDDFISLYTADNSIWIGLNSLDGTWSWDSGTGKPGLLYNGSIFGPWANGDSTIDPNNPCVYRGSDKLWHKTSCASATYIYLCQKYNYIQGFNQNDSSETGISPGNWQISFASPGECSIEVRVQSTLQLFSGFVTNTSNDFPSINGTFDSADNRIVTHLIEGPSADKIPTLYAILILDTDGETFYVNTTYEQRMDCSYEYMSGKFNCPNENSGNRFTIVHVGEDGYGFQFQRMSFEYCD